MEADFEVLTVAQLKKLLKEKGLPMSGKKVELVERLMANNDGGSQKLKQQPNQQLPFLTSVFKNGLSSVNIDKKLALRYGATLFMFIFIIMGLNSNSWYLMENTESEGDPGFGYTEQTTTLQFGLGNIEILYEYSGNIFGQQIDQKVVESVDYDGAKCESDKMFSCDSFSTAGTLLQICLWITMLSILFILGLGVARGIGKELPPKFQIHEPKILSIAWNLAIFLPLIGAISYGFIIGLSDMDMSGWDYGFGITWWSMMVIPFLFAGLFYNEQISSMISKFNQKQSK